MINLPKSRKEAQKIGSKFYFTGKICKRNHLNKRYTATGNCLDCKLQIDKDWKHNPKNQGRIKRYNKKAKENSKEKIKEYMKEYRFLNKNKLLESCRNYRKKNPNKLRKWHNNYSKRRRERDPLYKLHKNISRGIFGSLKKEKGNRSWRTFVNFSLKELKIHLEKQFRDGMTWENYGPYWHLDHIKPKSLCSSFEEAWELSNLQPLLAEENISKNNKYIGSPNNRIEVKF